MRAKAHTTVGEGRIGSGLKPCHYPENGVSATSFRCGVTGKPRFDPLGVAQGYIDYGRWPICETRVWHGLVGVATAKEGA